MTLVRRLGWMTVLLLGLTAARGAHTVPRLLLSHEAARPGETVWAGVELRMDSGWHTYWENPGDSGAPTTIQWKLPPGLSAGSIQWPMPEKYTAAGLTTYVFHDVAVLLVPLTMATDAAAQEVELMANLRWLECQEVCLPGKGDVRAKLIIGGNSRPSADAAALETARAQVPQAKPDGFAHAHATWENSAEGDTRQVRIEWTAQRPGAAGDFFPLASEGFTVHSATEAVAVSTGNLGLRKKVEKRGADWPREIAGVLVEKVGDSRPVGYAVRLAIAGPGSTAVAAAGNTAAGPGLFLINLGLAFLGGLILNLMPCVLPVIALKILGFVNQSHGSPAEVRRLGVIYGVGVLVSLLVLAGFVITVKSAGKAASWGMQFQNPIFVVAITTLVTVVALNLFGVFEVTLGGGAMGAAGALASREGAAGAFFNGVLAVILATPCTAPFLGLALGFAFAQPPGVIVLIFSAVAAGLAFPYVLLSFFPQFLKFVPKPGLWMERFKNAMGFPMLATALWLLTLTSAHYGSDGVLWVGLFLVLLALALWIWGQFVQRGSRRKGLAAAIAVLLILGGYGVALEGELDWRSPQGRGVSSSLKHGDDGIDWQPWSEAAVQKARNEGRPVFVDFTADWCITCQANKKTSIEIDSVRQRLKEINAVALLGDYTREDDVITAELQKFGRAGVPLVLVYPRDASRPPVVLPELLTPSIVLDALGQAAR